MTEKDLRIQDLKKELAELRAKHRWIPVEERPPEGRDYILLSFENFSIPLVGRYEEDAEGGAFYVGDDEDSCASQGLYVNAWKPLPEPYRAETDRQRVSEQNRNLVEEQNEICI